MASMGVVVSGGVATRCPAPQPDSASESMRAAAICFTDYVITIIPLAVCPPQLTRTVPVPGFVLDPILHVHDTFPAESAFLAPRPPAVLGVPAGVV